MIDVNPIAKNAIVNQNVVDVFDSIFERKLNRKSKLGDSEIPQEEHNNSRNCRRHLLVVDVVRRSVRRPFVRGLTFFIFVNAAHKNEAGPELQRGRGEICVAKIEMYDMGIGKNYYQLFLSKEPHF